MKKDEFDKINRLETTHWWYVGTREISFSILSKFLPKKDGLKILDIGCGTGGNLKELNKLGNAFGIDVNEYAVKLCNENGSKCVVGDLKNLNLEKNAYDLITLFDVINEIDLSLVPKILNDIKEGLSVNGVLVLREPAMKIAGGRHDLDVNIKFRLEKKEAVKLMEHAGFEILRITYVNSFLFLPILIKRKVDFMLNKTPMSDVYEHGKFVNFLLLKTLRLEKYLLNYTSIPFGVSILIVVRKRRPAV
ncbi:MAG: hypothetical protein A3A47_00015 [Candidatus Levybacteria bacterium RIFCSPLOWO2_01_FULL_37_20]|nr:MAG: hypothetical protein A3A47_00015 [Candidatus Levybacteria bacterium RIFCSPLOWO2_01_FULL_37_20]